MKDKRLEAKINKVGSQLNDNQKSILKNLGLIKMMKLINKTTKALPRMCSSCQVMAKNNKIQNRDYLCKECQKKKEVIELMDYLEEIKAELDEVEKK